MNELYEEFFNESRLAHESLTEYHNLVQSYEDAIILEGILSDIGKFFSTTGAVFKDGIVRLAHIWDTADETKHRAKLMVRASSTVRTKLKHLNYIDYKDELFPVPKGFESDWTSFINTLIDAHELQLNKSPTIIDALDTLNTIASNLSTQTDTPTTLSKHMSLYKSIDSKNNITQDMIREHFNQTNVDLVPLHILLPNFSEYDNLIKAINKLYNTYDMEVIRKISELSKQTYNAMNAAYINNKNNPTPDSRKLFSIIAGYVDVSARDLETISNMYYLYTTAIGMVDVFNKWVKRQ